MMDYQEYLQTISDEQKRQRVEGLVHWILSHYPTLELRIGWNQPIFTDHGTYILGVSVSKNHLAVSPEMKGIEVFSNQIKEAGFTHTKMLMQFPWNKELDFGLIAAMIEYNIKDKADWPLFWRQS